MEAIHLLHLSVTFPGPFASAVPQRMRRLPLRLRCYICIIHPGLKARISRRWASVGVPFLLLSLLLFKPVTSHADLMIELNPGQQEASRVLVKPPRARIEFVGTHYRLFDADQDAMITIVEDAGVYYRESPEALTARRDEVLTTAGAFLDWLAAGLEQTPRTAIGAWDDLANLWGLAGTDALDGPRPIRVEAVERLDEVAQAGGFECELYRVTLSAHRDRIRACLAARSEVGIAPADLVTLQALFAYLERLRIAGTPTPAEPIGLPPGLVAELIAHTDKVVLAIVNDDMVTGGLWEVHRIWSADLDPSRFYRSGELQQVIAPYAE